MGKYRTQQQTNQTTTLNFKKEQNHTFIEGKLVETTANYYQQNLIGQQNRPIRNNNDTCEIQETLRNKPHTIKNTEVKIQIKPGCYPIQQKARPKPYHLQNDLKNELDRLIKSGHLEKIETIEEDCFVSPVVITVKKIKRSKLHLTPEI